MNALQTLIKLQKTYVDEQREHLARLQDHLDQIDGRIAQLEITKAREQETAAKNDAARATYGAYLQDMVARGRALEVERQTAQSAVKLAQDRLAALFEEQKRYEIAEEQRLAQALKEQAHRETLELDEIGGVMHERKRGE